MQGRWKIAVAVGVACAVGLGWALGSPRAPDVQELPPEIPLYEGAQIEWTVQLTSQELSQQFDAWLQELSALTLAGYRIEGERALEVLSFYDQALGDWRRVLWAQPSESGGVRIFAQGRRYLSVVVSTRYEATDLLIVTAQADGSLGEVPVFEGAELQWQLVLTQDDLLELLKQWFKELSTNPSTMTLRLAPPAESSSWESLVWLGWLGMDALARLLRDFSTLNIVGYRVEGAKALDVLNFYEQQFTGWRRNLWIKPEAVGSIRLFSRSDEQGLAELAGVATIGWHDTTVIVLHARR